MGPARKLVGENCRGAGIRRGTDDGQMRISVAGDNATTCYNTRMPPSKRIRPLCTYTLDPDLIDGLKKLRERDGVSESETVRRALRKWLERKGVLRHGGPKAAKRTKAGSPARSTASK